MIHLWRLFKRPEKVWQPLGFQLSVFHGICALAAKRCKGEYYLCNGAGNIVSVRVWRAESIGPVPDADKLAANGLLRPPWEQLILPPHSAGGTIFTLGTLVN